MNISFQCYFLEKVSWVFTITLRCRSFVCKIQINFASIQPTNLLIGKLIALTFKVFIDIFLIYFIHYCTFKLDICLNSPIFLGRLISHIFSFIFICFDFPVGGVIALVGLVFLVCFSFFRIQKGGLIFWQFVVIDFLIGAFGEKNLDMKSYILLSPVVFRPILSCVQ